MLIVDDESSLTESLHEVLEENGYETRAAHNGKVALKHYAETLAAKEPYDLILLDIVMPAMNGIEVLREIRRLEKESGIPEDRRVRIVMLSALKDSWQADAVEAGCDGYITKPFSVDFLIRTIEENLKSA